MKAFVGAFVVAAALGCAPDEPDFGHQFTFAFISDYTLQTSRNLPIVDSCKRAFMLSGSLTFLVRKAAGDTLDGDGKLDMWQFPDIAGDLCPKVDIPTTYRTGLLAGPVTGTPSNARFVMQFHYTGGFQTDYTRTFTYAGTLGMDGGSGTLTYSIVGTSAGGTIPTTAEMVIPVTLVPVSGAVKIEPRPKG